MILILLSLMMSSSAMAYPDYFAVQIEKRGYKIFTKKSKCTGAVYQSGDSRVLFQDQVWKIGRLKNELDCNTLSADVEEMYRQYSIQSPEEGVWLKMTESDKNHWMLIEIKGFNKSVEVTGFKLMGGTKADDKSKEDCLRKDWGRKHPNKHIVVAFQDSNCVYDLVDQAELEYYNGTTIFLHPTGKNLIKIIFQELYNNIIHREGSC